MPNHGDTKTQRKTLKNFVTLCLIILWAVIQIGLSGLIVNLQQSALQKKNYFIIRAALRPISTAKFVPRSHGYT